MFNIFPILKKNVAEKSASCIIVSVTVTDFVPLLGATLLRSK